ncbi:MAG: CAP domain-containing protein [Clostridiaceae bacterium]|nr:CAP domain-containing protein [Clostridiaceae bacterium]
MVTCKKKKVTRFLALLLILIAVFTASCHRKDILVHDPVDLPTVDKPGTDQTATLPLEESPRESTTSWTVATSGGTTTAETQVETEETTVSTAGTTLISTKKTAKPPVAAKKTTISKPDSVKTERVAITTTTTTTVPPEPYYNDNYAQKVLVLLNAERAKIGKPALTMTSAMVAFAKTRAKELVRNCSHVRPNGSKGYTIITIPCSYRGEIIACGQRTPERVMQCWMSSDSHRMKMLDTHPDDERGYTQIGIACWYEPGSFYETHWAMLLLAPPE